MLFDILQFVSTFVSRQGIQIKRVGLFPSLLMTPGLLLCEAVRRRRCSACPRHSRWGGGSTLTGQPFTFSYLRLSLSLTLNNCHPAGCNALLIHLKLTPFHTLAPHLAPHCSPRRLGTYGFSGQEIRETCQPVVLRKHIFYPPLL